MFSLEKEERGQPLTVDDILWLTFFFLCVLLPFLRISTKGTNEQLEINLSIFSLNRSLSFEYKLFGKFSVLQQWTFTI